MSEEWENIGVSQVVHLLNGELLCGSHDKLLGEPCIDSRIIKPGKIFVAIKGDRYDGHDFIPQVLKKKVSGIIVQKIENSYLNLNNESVVIKVPDTVEALGDLASWWRRNHKVPVAAITGSIGKTTTKEMTANILAISSNTLKNKGNYNNLIGLPLTIFALRKNHERVILEMGMNQPGEIKRLTQIANPDIGLITNVAKAHLEGLGTIENVAKAKVEMVEEISKNSQVLLNGDDELLISSASLFDKNIIKFGIGEYNEIRAEKIKKVGNRGILFELKYEKNRVPIRLNLFGYHNVYNALAASSIAIVMGEKFENIKKGLEGYESEKGRLREVSISGGITLIDDTYNSNPASLKAAIDSVKGMINSETKLIIGLGDMLELGSESVQAHLEAGAMVAKAGAQFLFVIGKYSREMMIGAVKNGLSEKNILEVKNHEEMIQEIENVMEKKDFILLKGSRRLGLENVVRGLERGSSKEV